jgi:hypothetical protein
MRSIRFEDLSLRKESKKPAHSYTTSSIGAMGVLDLKANARTTLLQSATGVRQGDPLGPLFFCLGIAKAFRAAMEAHSDLSS